MGVSSMLHATGGVGSGRAGLRILGRTVAAVIGGGAQRGGGAGRQILVVGIALGAAVRARVIVLEHFLIRVIGRCRAELQADAVQP